MKAVKDAADLTKRGVYYVEYRLGKTTTDTEI